MLFARNLSKAYGAVTVLENISFVVNSQDRIGVVGANGVGKSTLFAILTGREQADSGFIAKLIGYGLFRMEDLDKKVGQLSLGQRRKLEIALLMADKPNVLLLDEPTNYISLDILEALERGILNFPGPVLAISHDRWFTEWFRGQVWRLEGGRLEIGIVTGRPDLI